MHNVNVRVADDGCLEVRSHAVSQAYWPEARQNLQDGVFRTSDLAEISFGLVYLRGRASDQINVAGRKVSPEVIEKALHEHPDVRDCVVFGIPGEAAERGDTIVACVAVKRDSAVESLRQFLLARLPAWQVPRQWRLVDSLEASARGKISRADWRRRHIEELADGRNAAS